MRCSHLSFVSQVLQALIGRHWQRYIFYWVRNKSKKRCFLHPFSLEVKYLYDLTTWLAHQIFYPRLTPDHHQVPQLCNVCSYWRRSKRFPSHVATKHLARVLHLPQKSPKPKMHVYFLFFKTGASDDRFKRWGFTSGQIKLPYPVCSLMLFAASTERGCGCRSTTRTQQQAVLLGLKMALHETEWIWERKSTGISYQKNQNKIDPLISALCGKGRRITRQLFYIKCHILSHLQVNSLLYKPFWGFALLLPGNWAQGRRKWTMQRLKQRIPWWH